MERAEAPDPPPIIDKKTLSMISLTPARLTGGKRKRAGLPPLGGTGGGKAPATVKANTSNGKGGDNGCYRLPITIQPLSPFKGQCRMVGRSPSARRGRIKTTDIQITKTQAAQDGGTRAAGEGGSRENRPSLRGSDPPATDRPISTDNPIPIDIQIGREPHGTPR